MHYKESDISRRNGSLSVVPFCDRLSARFGIQGYSLCSTLHKALRNVFVIIRQVQDVRKDGFLPLLLIRKPCEQLFGHVPWRRVRQIAQREDRRRDVLRRKRDVGQLDLHTRQVEQLVDLLFAQVPPCSALLRANPPSVRRRLGPSAVNTPALS